MLNTDKELKLYYSIGEVADMFGVNPSLLRFWEKEFPQISPKTASTRSSRKPCASSPRKRTTRTRSRPSASRWWTE